MTDMKFLRTAAFPVNAPRNRDRVDRMLKVLFGILLLSALGSAQTSPKPDTWKPLKFFVGVWEGTGQGEAGDAKVEREYKFVLDGKYLQAAHRSAYAPQTKAKEAAHEDLGFFSWDKTRGHFVFRQFNSEGFTIQFLVSRISDDGKTFVLDSEINENIPKEMRSRVTYRILNDGEFTETYEIAEPGKDLAVYFSKHFTRKK